MFQINHSSQEPIYKQIYSNLVRMIEKGELEQNETLPTIRQLAAQMDISINTVARAYQELETAGYIHSHGRRGSVVARGSMEDLSDELRLFKEPVLTLIRKGADRNRIEEVFRKTLDLFFE